MRGHGYFDALAGAIALGEATAEEREWFAAHCATCSLCTDDADALRSDVVAPIGAARDMETWRPQIRGAVMSRIELGRRRAGERTAAVLAGAVALSLALNAALATGLGQRAAHAIEPVLARVIPFAQLVASDARAVESGENRNDAAGR